MIKSILVAMDGSEHAWSAWHYAVDLAKALKARLRIVSVVDTRVLEGAYVVATPGFHPLPMESTWAAEESELRAKQQEVLEQAECNSHAADLMVRTQLAHGIPAETICSFDPIVDLIALGHHSELTAWDKFMMGSVADEVVRKSARPVLVSPQTYSRIERLLTAYDGSEPAQRALHLAAELAATLKLQLVVMHVNANHDDGWTQLRQAREYLAPYRSGEVEFVLRVGGVSEQILRTTDERRAGLIVMGAHAHGWIRKTLLGSATESVLYKMTVPVLMTR